MHARSDACSSGDAGETPAEETAASENDASSLYSEGFKSPSLTSWQVRVTPPARSRSSEFGLDDSSLTRAKLGAFCYGKATAATSAALMAPRRSTLVAGVLGVGFGAMFLSRLLRTRLT